MRRAALTALLAFVFGVPAIAADGPARAESKADLAECFRSPPDSAKPWAYWWWLNANVTKESITRDLTEMKHKGLGGLLLFDVTAYGQQIVASPPRRIEFMSPQWRELVRHAMKEADRLGLEMSINLSTCGGALRAPWKTGVNAPKALAWTAVDAAGPKRIACAVPRLSGPQAWDVAFLAVRIDKADGTGNQAARGTGGPRPEIRFSNDPKQWQPAVLKPGGQTVAAEVVDLTGKVDAQGRLDWDAPAGRWRLLRFVSTLMPDTESDVDMLDARAVEAHFRRFAGTLLEDAGPLAGKTLTHFYSVSWEGAIPTWTFGFDREFEKHRGYGLRPYLPVLAGMTVRDRDATARFLRDYSRTLSDCFMHNCYGTLGELCHKAGLRWHSESGGPWRRETPLFAEADALAFWGRNDVPQGEFWWAGKAEPDRSNARLAASAAHVYGRPLVSIEAFTHMRPHWSAYPAALKPGADAALCDGVNRFIWHTFSASPAEFGKPGIVYFAGTHLNPNVTWWEEAGGVLTYLGRCQAMLRQGRFVADVCCYRSERNYAAWPRGPRAKPLCDVPAGYAFDLVNTEVLVDRLSVKDGGLVLPDGMRYRVLVVDPEEDSLPPQALRKVLDLAKAGATVVLGTRRPQSAPGLANYPASDEEVRRLAAELWGDAGDRPFRRDLGEGKLVGGTSLEKALLGEGILPDFAGPGEYIHRSDEDLDVYFVTGAGKAEYTFRAQGREPELWDPVTGAIRDAVCYRTTDDGRTAVPIGLAEHGSVFVVFRRPARGPHLVSISGPETGIEVEGRSDSVARVRLWRAGRYVLRTSLDKEVSVDAAVPEALTVAGPWEVRFAPGWGAPERVVLDDLIAWDKHPDERIKHFSGKATYRTTLTLTAEQAQGLVRLELGEVRCVARVRVNGKDMGAVWTAPWAVDLSGNVRPGANEVEIDVINLWVNRLIGDAGLPEEKRLTKTNIRLETGDRTLKPYQGYGANDPLAPSGLLGPVRLEFGRGRDVGF